MEFPIQCGKRQRQGMGNIIGQGLPQIPKENIRTIGAPMGQALGGGQSAQEIPHTLRRCFIAGPPKLISLSLPNLLKRNASQRVRASKITGANPNQETSVDKFTIPSPVAHAVGHDSPRFRSSRHNLAPGADAKGIGRPAVGQMADQFVIRRGQLFPALPKLRLTDAGLWMLDPHANGKGLLLHGGASLPQHLKGIPGRVTWCQNQCIAGQIILSLFFCHSDSL